MVNVLLIAACAHAAEVATASTFRPWALNDSTAFVFPRIAEKRNRVRRERLVKTRARTGTGPQCRRKRGSLGRRRPEALYKSSKQKPH